MLKTLGIAREKGAAGGLGKAKVHDTKRVRVRVLGKDSSNSNATSYNGRSSSSSKANSKSISWIQLILAGFIVVAHVMMTSFYMITSPEMTVTYELPSIFMAFAATAIAAGISMLSSNTVNICGLAMSSAVHAVNVFIQFFMGIALILTALPNMKSQLHELRRNDLGVWELSRPATYEEESTNGTHFFDVLVDTSEKVYSDEDLQKIGMLKVFIPVSGLLIIAYGFQIFLSIVNVVLAGKSNCGSGRRGSRSQDGKTFEFDMNGREDFDAVMNFIGGAKWKKGAGVRINGHPHHHPHFSGVADESPKDVEVTLNPPAYDNLVSMDQQPVSAPYDDKIV